MKIERYLLIPNAGLPLGCNECPLESEGYCNAARYWNQEPSLPSRYGAYEGVHPEWCRLGTITHIKRGEDKKEEPDAAD